MPPNTPLTQDHRKPQNRALKLMDLGGESQPKEPRRVPTNFPHQIPKSKVPKTPQENHREGPENHHQEQPGTTQQSLEEPRRIIYTYQGGSYKV
jgi:hypothetical protein